jgi:hypothetical protein
MVEAVAPLYAAMASEFVELCARYDDQELAFILDFLRRANTAGAETIALAQRPPRRDNAPDAES